MTPSSSQFRNMIKSVLLNPEVRQRRLILLREVGECMLVLATFVCINNDMINGLSCSWQ